MINSICIIIKGYGYTMERKKVVRKKTWMRLHITFSLLSAGTGLYLWLEPKWRRLQRKRGRTENAAAAGA
jgi:hypothetical protein